MKPIHVVSICMICVVLWANALYPELLVITQNCRIVDEDGNEVKTELTEREIAFALLEAKPGEIVVKSALLEKLFHNQCKPEQNSAQKTEEKNDRTGNVKNSRVTVRRGE